MKCNEQTEVPYAMTLRECAAVLGITPGGVFMAEKSALRKAKAVLARKGYTPDVLLPLLRSL